MINITLLTSIVVISGMKILLIMLFMYDIWLVIDVMLLASCGPIETKKFILNSSAITGLLVINQSLMENIFLGLLLSDCFPIMFLNFFLVFYVRLINFKLITVILNFHVSQI